MRLRADLSMSVLGLGAFPWLIVGFSAVYEIFEKKLMLLEYEE